MSEAGPWAEIAELQNCRITKRIAGLQDCRIAEREGRKFLLNPF
jgi:hypothetical protein